MNNIRHRQNVLRIIGLSVQYLKRVIVIIAQGIFN